MTTTSGTFTEPELRAQGELLGRSLPGGSVVFLEGDLGSGKTTLVQAIARGLGVPVNATSPTYSLVHRYKGARGPVFHLDCYRLRSPDEAADLDWETLLREGDALLIEWPERAGSYLPSPTLRCRLAHVDQEDLRQLALEPGQPAARAPVLPTGS